MVNKIHLDIQGVAGVGGLKTGRQLTFHLLHYLHAATTKVYKGTD
jgi:hypothetical protein